MVFAPKFNIYHIVFADLDHILESMIHDFFMLLHQQGERSTKYQILVLCTSRSTSSIFGKYQRSFLNPIKFLEFTNSNSGNPREKTLSNKAVRMQCFFFFYVIIGSYVSCHILTVPNHILWWMIVRHDNKNKNNQNHYCSINR